MSKWSRGIRLWLISLIALAALLGAKSFLLDQWKPGSDTECRWLERGEALIAEQPPNWLAENSLIKRRIVDIRQVKGADGVPSGEIRVTVRSYVLGYLPFGDRYVTGPLADE